MPSPQPTFGTSLSYTPQEFPKSGRNSKTGQYLKADDAIQQSQLEAVGFVFAAFDPSPGMGYGTNAKGNSLREYPLVLHGPEAKTVIARDPGHEQELAVLGWRKAPYATVSVSAPATALASAPVNNALLDSMTSEYVTLQDKYAALQADLTRVTSERNALQSAMDSTGNQSKAALKKAYDELLAEHTQLKAVHGELLAVVQA